MSRKLFHLIVTVLAIGLVQTSLGNVLDPSLVGWWAFDEGSGTIAADSGPLASHGELTNDPVWRADGRRSACLFFDGQDDYVRVVHQDALNPGDGSFTVLFWANVDATRGTSGDTNWDLPVAKRDSGSNGYYVGADRNQGSTDQTGYRFMLGDTSATRRDTPFLAVPLEEWAFVAAVLDRDQDVQKISVDGGLTWETNTPPPGPIAPARDLGLGWDIGQNNYWVRGRIDDVAIFSRALSDAEISLIMRQGMTPALAKDGQPADGATDVPRDTALSWSAGLFAASHDVYLGTSLDDVTAATRANPLDVLVSEGQTATTYDPEALAYGQTYYWRIDEVNAAPDSTIFAGNPWRFTVEPFAYAVSSVTATSNGVSDEGKGPENTVNGSGLNDDDQHSLESDAMWVATPADGEPLHIQFEFDQSYKLHEMLVWNYNVEFELMLGFGFKDVTIEYSDNGVDWTVLKDAQFAQATATNSYAANTIVEMEGVAAQYIRLTANSGFGIMGQYGLSEVRFLHVPIQARQPQPADGAAEVDVDTILDWRAGREAAAHEVYFGTDAEALALLDTTTDTEYDPGSLDLSMTYYWKVNEVNDAEPVTAWEGQTWSFSTREYVVVDDFESYTDVEGTLIYETWIDGWQNESGSQVGYLDAPFTEGTIVHDGHQSMPLIYNNAVALGYSEAERFFDVPQDWTLHGTGSLTIYFRGALDNTGQLYVKINDVKVPYDGDAADIAGTIWTAWNIDLSSVNTNLTRITALTIGIEGADGQGTLYIDDIRLYGKPPSGIVPVEPDSAHLVAYFPLDGDATDASGNGHDGAAEGEPTYAAGILGQAIQLDGVEEHVRVAHHDSLNPGEGNFSMALWLNLDPMAGSSGSSNWDLVMAKRDTGSNGYYIGADRNQGTADVAGCKFMVGSTAGKRVDTGYLHVPLGEWVFVATVLDRDQNVHKISVDAGQTWATAVPPSGAIAPGQDLGIGWDIGQDNYWVHGMVDEVHMYNHALSDEEVAWLAGAR